MLVTIRDDTRNVLNTQHITPNSKQWDYSDIPGGHKKIKGPTQMVDVCHHLREAPNPHPPQQIKCGDGTPFIINLPKISFHQFTQPAE